VKVVACENTSGSEAAKADMNAKIGYAQAGVVKTAAPEAGRYLRP
jgi:hypothetical protein